MRRVCGGVVGGRVEGRVGDGEEVLSAAGTFEYPRNLFH